MHSHVHFRIQRAQTLCRKRRFRLTNVFQGVQRLSMQVAGIERVAIDDPERANARTRQIRQHRHTESTRTDDEYARRTQLCLTGRSDFAQSDLARIVRTGYR